MSKTQTQTTEQDDEQAAIRVQTGGDLWRSTTDLLSVLVDECKVHFQADDADEPEVRVTAVDPANVGMVDVRVPAEAFEVYEVPEETVVGLPLDELTSITDYARKGGNGENPGDPVIVEQVGKRIYVRVEPSDKWDRTGSFFEIPPDSIRREPDLPDLDRPYRGDVDPSNLRDALKAVKGRFDYVALHATGGGAIGDSLGDATDRYLSVYSAESNDDGEVRKEDEFRTDEKILHANGQEDEVVSLFSLDYLKDMSEAIVKAGFERLTLDLGQEFPVTLSFTSTTWGIRGEYMLAPRISSDGSGQVATAELSRTWGDRYDSTGETTSDSENDEEDTQADADDDATDETDDEDEQEADDEQESDEDEDEDEEEAGPPTCVSGDCENVADPEAVEEGYPFCGEHDSKDNRSLYDDLPADAMEAE